MWKTEEEWKMLKGGIWRIEVSGSYDREIQLTFKCHLWIVSIMPTTYITITALKSTRTLWPSITNSKCHKADTTGRTQALMTDISCAWCSRGLIRTVLHFRRCPRLDPLLLSWSFPTTCTSTQILGSAVRWSVLQTYPLHLSLWNKFPFCLLGV